MLYKLLAVILVLTVVDVVASVSKKDGRSEERKLRDTVRYLNRR